MNEWEWTPEQQAIIDRIQSGQTDFTFGPGSPNPTHEDIHTYVGGKYSPAGGFAVEGGVALAPKEYNMFTPEQRRALGIMDIAPKNQVGKIERYYGSEGMNPGMFASNSGFAPSGVPSPTTGGSFVREGNPAQMSTIADYGNAVQTGQAFTGLGSALSRMGQSQIASGAAEGAKGSNQALAMLLNHGPSALAKYLPPIGSYI